MGVERVFLVQAPGPEPYRVRFAVRDGRCIATCTCNAGRLGRLCKHRLALLKGETQGLLSGNAEDALQIRNLF